jgi:lysophospholipase L1-like esterase
MVAVDAGNDAPVHGGGRDLRICFIGDSLVQGVGDGAGGWVGRLAAATAARGLELTAYSLGVREDTSRMIASRWYEEAERRLTGGTEYRVVLAFGTNDTAVAGGQRRIAEERSAVYLAAMLRGAAEAGWPVLVVGPPPVADGEHTARIGELSRALQKVCGSSGVPYVALAERLADSAAWRESLAGGDGAHPGPAGYQLLAETVAGSGWWEWLDL